MASGQGAADPLRGMPGVCRADVSAGGREGWGVRGRAEGVGESMKEEQLNEIQARAAAATAGPWFEVVEPDGEMMPDGSGGIDGYVETGAIGAPPEGAEDPPTIAEGVERAVDRAFIIAARTDVPALLAALRVAQGHVRALAKAARAAVAGIEPMAASVDDLLCDLKRAAMAAEKDIETGMVDP